LLPAIEGLEGALKPLFGDRARDVTEENLQARARGVILMAISNKFGLMVVTTGNKSEMSVGYATLYGDMNGGFNPIKDLYKTQVYRLSHSAQPLEARRRIGARRQRDPGKYSDAGAVG
jgi:NAD+ synthase